jgi:hypothetical protein
MSILRILEVTTGKIKLVRIGTGENCTEEGITSLSNHDANLLTSEGISKFLFSNLEKQNTALSSMLLTL